MWRMFKDYYMNVKSMTLCITLGIVCCMIALFCSTGYDFLARTFWCTFSFILGVVDGLVLTISLKNMEGID